MTKTRTLSPNESPYLTVTPASDLTRRYYADQQRCTFTRAAGAHLTARCRRAAERDGLCAKHHPDRLTARRRGLALTWLGSILARCTKAELALVRSILTAEERKRRELCPCGTTDPTICLAPTHCGGPRRHQRG